MKVLRYGSEVASWSYKITCNYCKSELEIEAKDLKYAGEPGDWHDSGWETYSCNCLACTNTLSIPPAEIPPLVKVAAQKGKKK